MTTCSDLGTIPRGCCPCRRRVRRAGRRAAYVLVDTAVVGHLGSVPLAGLGVAGALMALLTIVGTFVEYGTTSRAARWYGAGRTDAAGRRGRAGVLAGGWHRDVLVVLGEVFAAR